MAEPTRLPQTCLPLPPRVLGALMAVLLGQALVLTAIRGGTSYDGAEQLLYTQYLDWGYGRSQPPLYTWLLWGLHQILGVTALAENLLKFTLIGVGLCGMAWLAQSVWPRIVHAGLAAVLLCVLVPDIAWEMQRNYAHSVLLFAVLPWGMGMYLRTWAAPTPARLGLLALLAGLSVLAKYNALLCWAALVLADWGVNGRRALPSRPAAWVAAGLAVAVLLPHALWVWQHPFPSLVIAERMGLHAHASPWRNALAGAIEWGIAWLGLFVLPALVVAAGLWHGGRPIRANGIATRDTARDPEHAPQPACPDTAQPEPRLLWLWTCWLVAALSLLAVVFSGMTRVQPRWLLPAAVPLLAAAAGWIATRHTAWRVLRWAGLAMAVVVIVGNWWAAVKPGARTAYDYATLATTLRAETAADVLVFADYAHFANLRLADPAWKLASPAMPRPLELVTATRPVALWISADTASRDLTLAYARAQGWAPTGAPLTLTLPPRWRGSAAQVTVQPLQRLPAPLAASP